jgi:hypothetical protein
VFLEKLANDYGVVPQNDQEVSSLLEMAARLGEAAAHARNSGAGAAPASAALCPTLHHTRLISAHSQPGWHPAQPVPLSAPPDCWRTTTTCKLLKAQRTPGNAVN